ncbi:ABC transporter substrate-binding protein [Aurantiacibacter sp. D1-12]|uniref:ABC transporter substrate-binding protein n=1 Tax=Aurantiacibacter sp. D1-12 TaxID=2993658 RepID=UPI00237C6330|nr:ABC transporter substrate-binding protein [Aurantiacibacter sp. D1-12]MDE1468557.1 ABC transporter substrate-binding protein [Aurantiacibacter sp. D1-12]
MLRSPQDFLRTIALLLSSALLAACSDREGAVDVALIGSEESAYTDGLRLAADAQHVRAATQSGLVAFNGRGEIVPALAERWVPTDQGQSFFFRLREGAWPNGEELNAASARTALLTAIGQLENTSLGRDLAVIEDIRAMTDRVLEVRLSAPEPYLLQLLAQPELALRQPGGGTGPMILQRDDERTLLMFKPPLDRGEPMQEDWQDYVRDINIHVAGSQDAITLFNDGEVGVVLGGDLGGLPLVETGPLTTGTLRIDSPFGLFGLLVRQESGLLGDSGVREGIAMAIDRERLLAEFNVSGWLPTTRPVSPGLPGDPGLVAERWSDQLMADRRDVARSRVRAWRQRSGEGNPAQLVTMSIAMPQGAGWDTLFNNLALQLAEIDIRLVRAEARNQADLLLIDRIARYPAPRWFLNQFHCSLRRGLCSEEVDALVEEAVAQIDPAQRATLMAQAEAELTLQNVYIPLASPLRWSLVRGSVDGYSANANAFHPLPELAQIPR